MWIEPYKDEFRFIEKYKDPYTGKWKRTSTVRKSATRTSYNSAMAELRQRIKELTESPQDHRYTLGEIADAYMEWQLEEYKKQSAGTAGDTVDLILNRLNRDTICDTMTAVYVRENLKAPPKTYNRYLTRFKALMRWAYANDYVNDIAWINKLQRTKEPTARSRNRQKYLEHDEITALLTGLRDNRWRLLTELLILSGMRVGEAIALLDTDVTDVISVTKTYARSIKEVSTAKTELSHRDVFIQPELASCIRKIRSFRAMEMMLKGYRTDIFLPNHNGTYCNYNAYEQYLATYSEKILGRRITSHVCRHTHVAMLAEADYPLEEIARRVGHESDVTRDIYFHVTKKMRQKDFEHQKLIKII